MNRGRVVKRRWATALSFSAVLSPVAGFAAWLAGPLPAPGDEVSFAEIVLSAPAGPRDVYAADLDGDGDIDILFASSAPGNHKIAWYQSNGGLPVTFTGEIIISTTALGVNSVFAADIDGDGHTDVLSASPLDHKIAWYRNDGAPLPTFTEQVISTNALGARSVFAADLDGDGDIDVLSASDGDTKVAWYDNDGESPPCFTERVIATDVIPFGSRSLFAADVDGDGNIDVLSASISGAASGAAWYENDGKLPPTFAKRVIFSGATTPSVYAADMDRDGDIDILTGGTGIGTLKWQENDGGFTPTFTEHVADPDFGGIVAALIVMDIDLDGNNDIIVATLDGDFAWLESSGGSPPTFVARPILVGTSEDESLFAADLDGDEDIDLLRAGRLFGGSSGIFFYVNLVPHTGDLDGDGDVDLRDYALFQQAMVGPF